ncbi:3D domain-containing protein [Bdellovibrio bacteriovorus]|uniref:3D domain-containing protein n=1 Tax=Bdellovibrio bacteriovorus TaxID=959 RepID=UPI0035A68F7E
MIKVVLGLLLVMGAKAQEAGFFEPPMPPPLPSPVEPTFLNPTIYYKPIIKYDVDRCDDETRVEMRSPEDKVLTRLCVKDFNNCVMQGACYVHDEDGRFRSFNYYARGEDGVPRFKEVDMRKCPYGYGMRNVCLDPYHTVAADLSIYKMGDVIFVPRLEGQKMPDGTIHDGFFVVRDAGGAIKGPGRFDFYTGFTRPFVPENTFNRLGFANIKNSFPYRMATEEEAVWVRENTGYPGTKKVVLLPPHR